MSTIIAEEQATSTQDVGLNGLSVNSPIVLATALLAAGSPLQRTKIVEVHLEYESALIQSLIIEYSIDGGTVWIGYSTLTTTITIGPTVVSCRKTLINHNMQLRLRSLSLGTLRILSFVPMVVAEAKVNP